MKAPLVARLAALERAIAPPETRHPAVHRIPWDAIGGDPEHHSGIVLPEKAPSAEAWAARMRQHWPQWGGGQP